MRLLLTLACVAISLVSLPTVAKSADHRRAELLYQMAKYIDFPRKAQQSLHFCFFTLDNGVGMFLQAKHNKNTLTIKSKPIKVIPIQKSLNNRELYSHCDITYFDGNQDNDILSAWIKSYANNTLILGSSFKFLSQGGTGALIQEGKKIRLYINREQLNTAHFKMQSQLLSVSKFYPN